MVIKIILKRHYVFTFVNNSEKKRSIFTSVTTARHKGRLHANSDMVRLHKCPA